MNSSIDEPRSNVRQSESGIARFKENGQQNHSFKNVKSQKPTFNKDTLLSSVLKQNTGISTIVRPKKATGVVTSKFINRKQPTKQYS